MKMNRFALLALLTFARRPHPAFSGVDLYRHRRDRDASDFDVGRRLDCRRNGTSSEFRIFTTPRLAGASVIGDGCFNGLPSISGDGTTVLGCHVDAQGNENAAKWLGGTSWQDLGSEAGAVPCGTSLSGAYGVNQDGSLGVGLLWRAQVCHANAGYWDLINGGPATVLPMLFSGPATRANAVNADGSVIVGWQDQPTGERTAAKWVDSGTGYVEELILTPSGGFNGEAHGGQRGRQHHRGWRL